MTAPERRGQNGPRVTVVQDGARLHYAVPLALQEAGLLARVFAEGAVPPGSPEAVVGRLVGLVWPALGRRLDDRWRDGLDPRRVARNPALAVRLRLLRRRFPTEEEYWAACSERVGEWVRERGWGGATVLFGFVRNIDPGLCRAAQAAGLATVGDQIIAPAAVEQAQFVKELARWPG